MKTDIIQLLLTAGQGPGSLLIGAERLRVSEGEGNAGLRREGLKYRGLVSGGVIRPAVSARWQGSKLGFSSPTEQGDRGPVLLDNDISKRWLSGPRERHF